MRWKDLLDMQSEKSKEPSHLEEESNQEESKEEEEYLESTRKFNRLRQK